MVTPKLTPHPSVALEEWVSNTERRGADFTGNMDANKGGKYRCRVYMYHNGNYVSADGYAPTIVDAFQFAVTQIERTVGIHWRRMP